MKELELKLVVPAERRGALLKALGLVGTSPVAFEAHYFDTPELRLHSAGMSLRLRKEGEAWIQTLKASSGNPAKRFEHSVPVTAGKGVPLPVLARHSGRRAHKALCKALGKPAAERLREVYRTDIHRRCCTIRMAGEVVEVAFDEGAVMAGQQGVPVCELELELKSGAAATGMFALAQRLVRQHGLWLSTLSKSHRGAQLVSAGGVLPVGKASSVRFGRQDAPGRQFRAMLENCLSQITGNASLVAGGCVEAHQIHQLRVGLRRLRTVLRDAGALVDQVPAHWEPTLRTVFQSLGAYRDQQSVSVALQPRLEAAGAPLSLARVVRPEATSPQEAVRSPGFQAVLLELLGFTLQGGHGAGRSSRDVLGKRIDGLHRKVLADGRRFSTLEADEQHRVRKRLKRLRYLGELSAPIFGAHDVERYLAWLRPAQDALGEHHDGLVALEGFTQRASKDGRAWFGAGWLTAMKDQTARDCEKALTAIRKAPRFW